MHAHSLLWFAALLAAAGALYRRLSASAAVAGLSALLYAVDDAHGFAAGWLANRNGLMAALFGLLCLHAYARWRAAGWKAGAVLAPLWLLLGALSAEAALGALAYIAAHALCLDRAPSRHRLIAILPLALIVLVWAAVYRALGFGAWGTAYVDPLAEPLAFVRAVIERAPVLLLAQWFMPPAELYPFLGPATRLLVWLAGVGLSAGLAWLFLPLLRRSPTARFWALGMLLSLIPISAALPANRLLFFTGLGALGLLSEYIGALWLPSPSPGTRPCLPRPGEGEGPGIGVRHHQPSSPLTVSLSEKSVVHRLPALVAQRMGSSVVLLLTHLLISPLLLPLTAYSPALLGHLEPAALSLPISASDTVVLLNAPSFFSASFLGTIRAAHGLPVPAHVRYLGAGPVALEVTRRDAQTLVVRPVGGYLTGFDSVFRGPGHPLAIGERVVLAGLVVEVLALTADGRPAAAAFHFALPLEAPALRWFAWQGGVFVPFTPPAVGQTLSVPALPWTDLGRPP
jgi:hypothetical protein